MNIVEAIYMSFPERLYEKLSEKRLFVLLNFKEDFGEPRVKDIIKIETGCYNSTIAAAEKNAIIKDWDNREFELLYNGYVWNVWNILKKYPEYWAKIDSGEINPKKISSLEPCEVMPNLYDKTYKEKVYSVIETVKTSTIYFCPSCKRNKTTYKSIQNRSADEGLGVEATCTFCVNILRV